MLECLWLVYVCLWLEIKVFRICARILFSNPSYRRYKYTPSVSALVLHPTHTLVVQCDLFLQKNRVADTRCALEGVTCAVVPVLDALPIG